MPIQTTQSVTNIRSYGGVGDGVTSDQTAFENAIDDLTGVGGTIFFPKGTWRLPSAAQIWASGLDRDNIRLLGESENETTILCDTGSENGIELSEYRRGGWQTGLNDIIAYTDDVKIGQSTITLQDASDASKLSIGDKIFIAAGGSAQFDQEYGEFNIVKDINGAVITLEKNLSRDYRTDYATWSAEVNTNFTAPALNDTVDIQVDVLVTDGEPGSLVGISIGNELYEFVSSTSPAPPIPAGTYTWTVRNIRSTNQTGVTIDAGTKIFKQRVIIRTPETTRGTVIENLTIEADGDVINFSNSMDTVVKNCTLIRRSNTGGLWADFDGGRNSQLINCKIIQEDVWDACQPARSFGELKFYNCEFFNAAIDWSEYCYDGEAIDCNFYLSNPTDIPNTYGISLGWSTSNMRVEGCKINGDNIGSLIDTEPDINGYRGAFRGGLIIKNNKLQGTNLSRFIRVNQAGTTEISGNHLFGDAEALLVVNGHIIPADSDGLRNAEDYFINSSLVHYHHNYFAGVVETVNLTTPTNLILEDSWFHYHEERSGLGQSTVFKQGNIMHRAGQPYGHIEILKVRRNVFKNWPYADGVTPGGGGTPSGSFNFDPAIHATDGETVRTDISDNLFLDAQQSYIGVASGLQGLSEFVIDIYP